MAFLHNTILLDNFIIYNKTRLIPALLNFQSFEQIFKLTPVDVAVTEQNKLNYTYLLMLNQLISFAPNLLIIHCLFIFLFKK